MPIFERYSKSKLVTVISIATVNLRLIGHRVICIMVNLNIFVVDIISLDNCSQVELSLLIM